MCQKFEGLIFLIDVGMSEAIDYSRGALLRVHGKESFRATAIYPNGTSRQFFEELVGM
jgi:hypothetical protein